MLVAIAQARMGSCRFPGKVMKEIEGKSLLELFIRRVKPSRYIEKFVVATTTLSQDNAIEGICNKMGVSCFRGSETDLLDRYYQCAKLYGATAVIRITPDNPFVDYEVIDHGIEIFKSNDVDFVTNHFDPTYPEGLDIEIYSLQALEHSWKEAKLPSEREHVFPYIRNHRDEFKIINFKQERDLSHLRWTIDYECDFEMAKIIYQHLYAKKPIFLQRDILHLVEQHPEIAAMNAHVKRKEGVNRTIQQERKQHS